jgi:epoxyqueuosine reductase
MERGEEKRCDPQKVLPGARSVIVMALNYFQDVETGVTSANSKIGAAHGRVARYAWGDDYHDVIAAKLDKMTVSFITGGRQKYYVDTAQS